VAANGYIAPVDKPEAAAATRVVRVPVGFSGSAAAVDAHVPELGEHTEQVLLEVGYSWDDIAALSADGAV